MNDIAKLIDHSLLRPEATSSDIKKLCSEAVEYGFYAVCVNPCFVTGAKGHLSGKKHLSGSEVKITAVIGFPLGASLTEVKVYEAMKCEMLGADELDIVINIGAAKSGDWGFVRKDLSGVIMATKNLVHKAIIECCYLTDEEKIKAVEACLEAGAEFIKTSTGFSPGGARVEDIKLIKSIVGGRVGIKAAGGIKTLKDALAMVEAGATRIGTSNGVRIVRG